MGHKIEYLKFNELSAKGKTKRWVVTTTLSGDILGEIMWRSGWRKYVFSPQVYILTDSHDCLRKIADFIEQETAKQRATWKRPPKESKND